MLRQAGDAHAVVGCEGVGLVATCSSRSSRSGSSRSGSSGSR